MKDEKLIIPSYPAALGNAGTYLTLFPMPNTLLTD